MLLVGGPGGFCVSTDGCGEEACSVVVSHSDWMLRYCVVSAAFFFCENLSGLERVKIFGCQITCVELVVGGRVFVLFVNGCDALCVVSN